ncbi:phosphatase PAP2 family protein [Pontibacter cellulosilyticus]|uniref:Phosphatase PAP2 family protein n=1 Tax=Pontibacter cellulosilyticus TaxID=1720253 RepID=A0A923N519_9BACT|nr:phosphatase PAP2 family protein [Pontibacter cellulosilyticus]MBC5991994.1 phosphatase PAP2 family protein [Pontibacter cellulosilyticus]
MEPMYIYATPAQVKQELDFLKAKANQREVNKIDSGSTCSCKVQQAPNKATMKAIYTLLLGMLFLTTVTVQAQTSQQKSIKYKSLSPETDHYKTISTSSVASKGGELESIAFPMKDFRRGAYLKMRTVYLDVPVQTFKIKPYPANSSEQTRTELDFLLGLQAKRTAQDAALTDTMAVVYHDPFTVNPNDPDYSRNTNSLFYVGRNLGPWFNPEQLPVTSRVLQNVIQDATYYFFSLKAQFNRARPYHLEPRLQNLEAPGHASYPSGHSSASHVHAYLLGHLLPEYKDQFLSNAYDMAFSREIRGVHYPSDSEAGREFAEQFVAHLLKSKTFKADLEAMKAEIAAVMAENKLTTAK